MESKLAGLGYERSKRNRKHNESQVPLSNCQTLNQVIISSFDTFSTLDSNWWKSSGILARSTYILRKLLKEWDSLKGLIMLANFLGDLPTPLAVESE